MKQRTRTRFWPGSGIAVLAVALCTVIAHPLAHRIDPVNIVMLFLLTVAAVAVWAGRGASVLASVLSVAAFDFFFVPPRHTFAVEDTQYLVTFGVMLVVALTIGTLTARLSRQAADAERRETRTAALYRMSRDLAALWDADDMMREVPRMVRDLAGADVAVQVPDADGRVGTAPAAQIALDQRHPAGWGTPIESEADRLFVPMIGGHRTYGVLAVTPWPDSADGVTERIVDLQALANMIAVAVERGRFAAEAEAERTRSALLASISHDLRTPLAAITGAATTLLDDAGGLTQAERRDLLASIAGDSDRLSRLVANLLQMTRLESTPRVRAEWHSLEDVIGAALGRCGAELEGRSVDVRVAEDVPLVLLDDVLMTQALVHLVENALAYTPPGSPIDVEAARAEDGVTVTVSDRGPGIAPGQEQHVFEKFVRGAAPDGSGRAGAGLGLAICRAIVAVHGGRIEALPRAGGGAVFRIHLPITGQPPAVVDEVVPV